MPLSLKPYAGFPEADIPGDWQPALSPAGGKRNLMEGDETSGLQLSVELVKITQ